MKRAQQSSEFKKVSTLLLTGCRLICAERMVREIRGNKSIVGSMAVFVVSDILDGVIARKLSVESPQRRFMDALVDRLSMARVAQAVRETNDPARPYISSLGAREGLVCAANAIHYLKTREVVQGTGIHRLGSLSIAAFGIIAANGNEQLTHTSGTIMSVLNFGLASDYIHNAIRPHGSLEEGIRIIAFDKPMADSSPEV